MVFAFDQASNLDARMNSAERTTWLDRTDGLTDEDGAMRVPSGLESWFALRAAQARQPMPRWKMVTVTWLGIFLLLLGLSNTVGRLLAPIHPVLAVMVATALVTLCMTWLVMPLPVHLPAHRLHLLTAAPA